MVSVCLPSDALLQHLPSYLGFSYLGHRISLHGCSSKVQLLLLTLDKGYLLTATPPDIEHGVAPLGPPAPSQSPLLTHASNFFSGFLTMNVWPNVFLTFLSSEVSGGDWIWALQRERFFINFEKSRYGFIVVEETLRKTPFPKLVNPSLSYKSECWWGKGW